MKRGSRRKRHRLLLEVLRRYGWEVEACYVRGDATRWCIGSVDGYGRQVFCHVCDDPRRPSELRTTRTPPFRHAEHLLTFVVVPAVPRPGNDVRLVRTWPGMQRFVDEARGKWILAEARAGRLGDTAKRLLGRYAE
jgi:hypothetical protein